MSESTPEPTPATPSGSPSTNQVVETLKSADRLDLGIIGAGLLAFLGSLLPYYTVTVEVFGTSATGSGTAWGSGFFGWFGALLAVAGAGVLLAKLLGVALPFPERLTVLGLFAGALLFTLLALVVFPGAGCNDFGLDGACDGYDEGHGFGYWLALLATIAGTALAAMRRSAD